MTDDDWRQRLTPEQYRVLREKGTERAFVGAYVSTQTPGVYRCAGCHAALFSSTDKFESGCGWPSFTDIVDPGTVRLADDRTHGMHRIEVTCATCGGHLGHVFDDGPRDSTGLRYCINSVALDLDPDGDGAEPPA
jgi:peptide-methionine (R)-S-oxide reductase